MLARHASKPSAPLRRHPLDPDAASAQEASGAKTSKKRALLSLTRAAQAEQLQLANGIRARLKPDDARRVGLHHAVIVLTLRAMPDGEGDVPAIYKALGEHGHAMVMSRLYRSLKLLEEAGMVQRNWMLHDGRPRSTYRLVDGDTPQDAHGEPVCSHCGAILSRR